MNKTLKRLTAILLGVAVLVSALVFSGAAGETATTGSTTTTLDFDNAYSFAKPNPGNTGTVNDADDNAYYPYWSNNGNARVYAGETITVKTSDGGTKEVTALKTTTRGASILIPTDANGVPYVVEPNTQYTVSIDGYIQCATNTLTMRLGGCVFDEEFTTNAGNRLKATYLSGTENGEEVANVLTRYPMYNTGPVSLPDASESTYYENATTTGEYTPVSYFTEFDETNTAQRIDETLSFTTGDFTNTNNSFITDIMTYGATKSSTVEMGTYFSLSVEDYGSSFYVYQDDGTGTHTQVGTAKVAPTIYIDKITITKVVESEEISVTYDANGGSFADESATKTVTETTGTAPTVEEPTYTYDGREFLGWSTTKNGSTITAIDETMAGQTLYAVWGIPAPHPSTGNYSTWSRTIGFEEYVVLTKAQANETEADDEANVTVPKADEAYGDYSGKPYYTVIEDPDNPGNKLLQYYNYAKASNYGPNWCITPTPTGQSNANSDAESGQVLPTNSRFRLTLRLRMEDTDGGSPAVYMYYGIGSALKNGSSKNKTDNVKLSEGITINESDEWQDIVVYFTTPDEYTTVEQGVANRLYVGIICAGIDNNCQMKYDLDYIKLEKLTTTEFYVKQADEYVLYDSVEGVPGEALTLPESYSEEVYSDDSTGYGATMKFSGWYSDEACSKAAIEKFANSNFKLYCNSTEAVGTVDTTNQEMFVGFDKYSQPDEGLSNATITDETAKTGTNSLKATGNASFELRNRYPSEVLDGKTYKADFSYKSSANVTIGFGFARSLVANAVTVKNSVALSAANDWAEGSVIFTADGALETSALAATITAADGTVTYIDNIRIYSVTESIGVEAETAADGEALRFMFSFKGTDEDTVKISDTEYTVAERGVLIKGAELETALNLDNKDANGVFHFAAEDLSKNYGVNPVTGHTTYTAYISGFDVEDDYKVTVRGYVKLGDEVYYTDTLTASVSDIPDPAELIPDTADLSDYYVYLPEGTTLSTEIANTVTTYDEMFAETNAVEANTFTKGAYAKFSAKPEISEIDVPSELKYLVHAGTKADLYFGLDAHVVTENINSVGEKAVNYLFITDTHIGSDPESVQAKALINQTTLMTKMANENDNIDFVVIGGDITTGMFGTKEACITAMQSALDPFLKCTKPVFVLMGNHDDNSYHLESSKNETKTLYTDRIITDLDWQINIINRYTTKNGAIEVKQDNPEKRANSKYFYYDLEGKNTRVIALDALDYEAKYDENGYVLTDEDGNGFYDGMPVRNSDGTNDRAKYWAGVKYWGYSADQTRWLAEDALGTLPEDYDVIFVSHMGIDKSTNSYDTTIHFGDEIRDVLKAYNAGGTYTANLTDIWGTEVPVNADFSGKNGKLLSWQFGHQHLELSHYSSDLDLWQICTSTANVSQAKTQSYDQLPTHQVNDKTLPWRIYTRDLETATEACFNAMSVSSERVYRYTVGQGANETMVYPN